MARTLLLSTLVLIALAILAAGLAGFYGLWLAVPIALAVTVTAARGTRPLKAALLGTAVTFGVVVGVVFPLLILKAALGDFDNTDYCDGLCFTNGEGFLFATYIMLFVAIPLAVGGGLLSLITSTVTTLRARGS